MDDATSFLQHSLPSRASCYTGGLSLGKQTNQQIKVWSDSESSLHSIDTQSPIAQQTQEILLKSTNIKLGWITAHVGYSGNEATDVLAKKATQEEIPSYIPAASNHIKSLLQKESIIRWQKEWDNGETGRSVHNVLPKVKTPLTPWQRPEIIFATGHGPFLTYLKRFKIRNSDSCGCGNLGNTLHCATSCLFTTSYHLTKPSADLKPLWWKKSYEQQQFWGENQKTHPLHRGKRDNLFSKRW
ncbi:hypothetical protein AVEN_128372-1 [Araneus ventricosus]|uniref:Uncharacterized protein n=1 Tax=Araneus ventricosus TaxID=182803 RepID=A0A4Y2DFI6_ARAVE|nr:hypothetical protein AVEN_128372-1 [Araneus ventricosus]